MASSTICCQTAATRCDHACEAAERIARTRLTGYIPSMRFEKGVDRALSRDKDDKRASAQEAPSII